MSFINRPIRKTDNRFYIPSQLVLGNFALQTDSDGSIKVQPASSPSQTNPSFVAKPVSINLDASGIYLDDAVSTGGRILLETLLANLLETKIILPGQLEMPLKSLFGTILSRLGSVEGNVADISGVRLASEEAKSAADDIREALQDASGALLQLAVATAASDLAGVLGRVSALESAPGFDSAPILASIADLSGVAHMAASTAQAAAADVLLAAGAISDLSGNIRPRVDGLEAIDAGTRLGSVETAIMDKVSSADFATYQTATDAAIAAKADASALAAKADASAVEAIGLMTKREIITVDLTGSNSQYWAGPYASMKAGALAGKLVELAYSDAEITVSLDIGTGSAGQVASFRNIGTKAISVEFGLPEAPITEVQIQPAETVMLVSDGSSWRIM